MVACNHENKKLINYGSYKKISGKKVFRKKCECGAVFVEKQNRVKQKRVSTWEDIPYFKIKILNEYLKKFYEGEEYIRYFNFLEKKMGINKGQFVLLLKNLLDNYSKVKKSKSERYLILRLLTPWFYVFKSHKLFVKNLTSTQRESLVEILKGVKKAKWEERYKRFKSKYSKNKNSMRAVNRFFKTKKGNLRNKYIKKLVNDPFIINS